MVRLNHIAPQDPPDIDLDDDPSTPPKGPNDLIGHLKAVTAAKVGAVALQLVTIDGAFEKVNMLLSRLQPWHSGRVGITIENRGDHMTVPRPKVFMWRRELFKWAFIRIPGPSFSKKVKTSRAFHENQKIVKELCAMAYDLMKARAGLLQSVSNFTKSVDTRMLKAGATTEAFVTRMDTIEDEIAAKKHCIDFSAWKIDDPE